MFNCICLALGIVVRFFGRNIEDSEVIVFSRSVRIGEIGRKIGEFWLHMPIRMSVVLIYRELCLYPELAEENIGS